MTISTKLLSGFLTVSVITLVVGGSGYYGVRQAGLRQKEILSNAKATRSAVDRARSAQVNFKTQVQEWKNILLRGHDAAAFEKHFAGFAKEEAEAHADLTELVAVLPQIGLPATNAELAVKAHQELGGKYREALKSFVTADEHSSALVDKLVKGMDRPPTEAIDGIVAAINQHAEAISLETEKQSRAQARIAQLVTVLGAVVGVLISVTLGVLLSFAVSKHIRTVAARLFDSANQVASAAGQVSAASQTLAEGASEQAASLEETSASLEELSSMTKRNAESAQTAKALVGETRQAADRSAADVEQMTRAMAEVKSSSEQVTKIIKTIDEIAFQTNILALNAAVEAARAGEAGAGFAVVANEVRNLAQRSAEAARETADKIEDALQKTQHGVEISNQVAQGLKNITGKVREVDQLVAEIATASQEQNQGISQVNTAVSQMDKVTQSNAATAEETASASQELTSQAATLRTEVTRLAGTESQPTQVKPSAAPTPATMSAPILHHTATMPGHTARAARNGASPDVEGTTHSHAEKRQAEAAFPMDGDFKDF